MKELKLSRPIMAHNENLHVLEIREPTYAEVETLGIPFGYTGSGDMKVDSGATLKYLPLLAGIPRSSAEKMALKDIFMASMLIVGFFTGSETPENSDSDFIIQPGSGN